MKHEEEAVKKPKDRAMFITSKDTLDGAFPGLVLGINAGRLGMEASIFYTFMGLNVIRKGWVENAKFQPPGFMGAIPGMSSIATWMMKSKITDERSGTLVAQTARTARLMLKIVLFEPEIPPNTGNIILLCANTGCSLHLIEPLGFDLDVKKMRRAGLDYREFADIQIYPDMDSFVQQQGDARIFAATTKGGTSYHQVNYRAGDAILFGPETRGLPQQLLNSLGVGHTIRIPMKRHSRSLNLSNAAALVVFEGLRQMDFPGLK